MSTKSSIFSFLLCSLVLMSCGKESLDFHLVTRNNSIELKQDTEELEGETIDIIENLDGLYTDVHYYNDLLYVLNQDDHCAVDVIDPSTGNVVLNIGSIGEGDYDFRNSETLKVVDVDSIVQIYDFSRKSVSLFDSESGGFIEQVFLSDDYATAQSALLLSERRLVSVDLQSNAEFTITIDGIVEHAPDFHVNTATCSLGELKPRNIGVINGINKVVTTNLAWNYINLYSTNGEEPIKLNYGTNENIVDGQYAGREHMYYYDTGYEDNTVYALYLGVSTTKKLIMGNIGSLKSELHSYNLEDSTATRYILDRLVNACSYDNENKLYYCIDENNNDHPIVLFKA